MRDPSDAGERSDMNAPAPVSKGEIAEIVPWFTDPLEGLLCDR